MGARAAIFETWRRRRPSRPAAALAATLALSACAMPGGSPDTSAFEAGPPEPRGETDGSGGPDGSLTEFYAGVEGDLTSSGRMRRETSPADAPYTIDDLVRNFERIALYDEYVDVGGRFLRAETPALLRRWNRPVRVGVMTSRSVPPEEASRDRANVAGFTRKLARLTGLDMQVSDGAEVNYLVLFMNSAERVAFAEQAAGRYPNFAPAVMDAMRDTPLDTFCTAYAFGDPGNPSVYSAVMILIRAEHPPLTRLSCVHEEMAQAMGLPNDSPDARPSLFNDSLEFALLTEHDEVLLRMLYDPRLRPGMSAAEARPLLPDIARDAVAAQRATQVAPEFAMN